ncbi:M20/M25/M40 family metallo-hydrolase [Canibacter zhoujuaniae]|uniref:M20/M25/M40 family metallo-hydrolase n=1 Tax=Canibacter zhoujuaniae TaxID=2708343 RepID=UPI00141F6F6E|nr:M20/M25/M40 family metallo-hydrolase [Canibacter zhoujuaniae]
MQGATVADLDFDPIELLTKLVTIETPTGDTTQSAKIAQLLKSEFTRIGGTVKLIDTAMGTSLVADFAGLGKPFVLLGHTDTVWPLGTLAEKVPLRISPEKISGPGVYDMKAGIVVMLTALARLRETAHQAVRVVLVCDEEVGSPTTKELLLETCAGAKAVLGFESPHPDGALKVGRRGSVRMRLSTQGRAAHAALDPENGVNAIDELVDQLLRVREITADPAVQPVLCNVGQISGGERANVVADEASTEIGLRFFDSASEEQVLDALTHLEPTHDEAEVAVEILSRRPTWEPGKKEHALLDRISSAADRVGQEIECAPAAGAGDTNFTGAAGFPSADGFGPRGAGAHAVHEHILVESLWERIDLITALLRAAPQVDNKQ